MDDMKMLYDLVKEIREDQKEHGKLLNNHSQELTKQSSCIDSIQKDLKTINKAVEKNTEDLTRNTEDIAEHMRRTEILEQLHKDNQIEIKQNQERIIMLEEPLKAKEYLKKNFHWLLTSVSLVVGMITKIMGLW